MTNSRSFVTRTEVYKRALNEWEFYPLQLVIGMGPDFLEGSGLPHLADNFKKSKITGAMEGTVDSGWLSYLIELGVLPLTILLVLYFKSAKYSYNSFKLQSHNSNTSPVGLYIFAGLLFMSFALTTQMLGYTKICWFPFQLLIFGLMYKNNEIKSDSVSNPVIQD